MISPRERAHRTLRKLKPFVAVDDPEKQDPQLGASIGFYDNRPLEDSRVLFFDRGLVIASDGEAEAVLYQSIRSSRMRGPLPGTVIVMMLKNGTSSLLSIKGRRGNILDATEVLRFLDRVVADQDRET